MKDIFLCLLLNITKFGKLASAMFDDGFAKITLVGEDAEYDISVIKKVKMEEEKND